MVLGMARVPLNLLVSEQARDHLDGLAAETGLTRSHIVRMLLAAALADPNITARIKRTPTQEAK